MPFNVGDIIELDPNERDNVLHIREQMHVDFGDLLQVTRVDDWQSGNFAGVHFIRVDGGFCNSGWDARRFKLADRQPTPHEKVIRVIHKIKKKREALGYQW